MKPINFQPQKILLIGITNYIFSYFSLIFIYQTFHYFNIRNYFLIIFISHLLNIIFSYLTNKYFYFKTNSDSLKREFLKAYLTQAILFLLNYLIFYLGSKILNINIYILSLIIATYSSIVSILFNHIYVFQSKLNHTTILNSIFMFFHFLIYSNSNNIFIKNLLKLFDREIFFSVPEYILWRKKRVDYIVKIFGKNFFRNKSCLELGCGYGDIGKYFQSIGANVTFAEGSRENFDFLKKKIYAKNKIFLNQDKKNGWNLNKKFDFIIHWGVSYHLKYWKEDLYSTMKHSEIIFFETETLDIKTSKYVHVKEWVSKDQALYGIGNRPSEKYIENLITKYGWHYIKCTSSLLDTKKNIYSWKIKNSNKWKSGQRRFYLLFKNQNTKEFYKKKIK